MPFDDDGGSAFPVPERADYAAGDGMRLRDYFAASALQGLLACSRIHDIAAAELDAAGALTCKWAYKLADAMLEERSKP